MRLLHTEPIAQVIKRAKEEAEKLYSVSHAHTMLVKNAGDATTAYALSGELYASKSGWILLDVPNALVRGAFDALNEPGVELPPKQSGGLNAHISVMRPEELAKIGGVDKITERGHHFHYTLGPIKEVKPSGWDEMSKVWYIQVRSPELQDLRKSYGLSAKPNDDKFDFHITIAVRRKKVLQSNEVAKAAGIVWPALRVGGIVTDVAGLKALGGHHGEEIDPASAIMADDEALARMQQLPTALPARRRKKVLPPPALVPVLNEGVNDGLLEMRRAEEARPQEKVGHEDDAAEEEMRLRQEEAEEDFDCHPDHLSGIYAYYDGNDTGDTSGDSDSAGDSDDPDGDDTKSAGVFGGIGARVKHMYGRLEKRYGPTMAKAVVGSGIAGLALPVPGGSVLAASPALAAGEAIHAYRGNYDDPEHKKQKRRHELVKKLRTMALPAAGAGAAGAALHSPTDTLMPAQVTKFPDDPKPHLVRGPIYPGAPSSVLEDTGGGYMFVGPSDVDRAHGQGKDLESFKDIVQKQQRPGVPLQKLEIEGHGSYAGQSLGDTETLPGGFMNPDKQLSPKTTSQVIDTLKAVPKTDDATVYGYGCNTGLCRPEYSWWQHLSDETGMKAMGARGYVTSNQTGTQQDVHSTAHTRPGDRHYYPPVTSDKTESGKIINDPGEDYTFTKHQPHQPQEVVKTQDRDSLSKQTWAEQPAGQLSELLYNIGKPSAIAGAVAAPLLSDRRTAKRTALTTSALAAPMALSELIARAGQAQANIETGNADPGIGTYLNSEMKALPYAGLAALPLLSYGGAKLLGRWKKPQIDRQASRAHTAGALAGGGTGMLAGSAFGPLGAAGGGALGLLLGELAGKRVHNRKK
jgi:hypothetical protein